MLVLLLFIVHNLIVDLESAVNAEHVQIQNFRKVKFIIVELSFFDSCLGVVLTNLFGCRIQFFSGA